MKKNIVKFILGVAIIPACTVGLFYSLNKNGFFDISEVQVIIENPTAEQQRFLKPHIENLQKRLSQYQGVSLWDIKLKKISREISGLSWVESLNIKRNWPSSLAVHIHPQEVKLLFLAKNGNLIPIIKNGAFLAPIQSDQAPDVALIEGEDFLKKEQLRKQAVDVIEQMPDEGAFSKKTISEIRHDPKEGFWLRMIKSGIEVKMGLDQMPLKAARVSKVIDYLDSHQFEARVIDANLSKKVLVRLRKGP